jgi:hypothetical protein
MPRLPFLAILVITPGFLLSGCIARTVVDVATAPVRVAGKAVDLATTSQSESDEKRGRDMRRREERLGKLERDAERARRDCYDGNRRACEQADGYAREIEDLQSDWR